MERLAVVTGFGAFEEVRDNPSGPLAERLAARPPEGWEVRARELPVSFRRAPQALDELCRELPRSPDLLLALGVHRKPGYRLERAARGAPLPEDATRTDVDGERLADVPPEPGDLSSGLPVDELARFLQERLGVVAWASREAGAYVCERVYHRLLRRGAETGAPALFVHVPPLAHAALDEQEAVLRALLGRVAEL